MPRDAAERKSMRRDTGQIISESEARELNEKYPGIAIPLTMPPTAQQQHSGKIGRNDPCPCGSGKKFKKCCWLSPEKAADNFLRTGKAGT